MKNSITFRNQFFLAAMALFLSFGIANAQTTNTFTNGGGDGLWNNPANWDLGTVPTTANWVNIENGDDVTISAGVNAEAVSVAFKPGGGTLTVEAGATLLFPESTSGSASAMKLQYGGHIINNGTITVLPAGSANYAGGINMTNVGPNTFTNNGTLSINDVDNRLIYVGSANDNNVFNNNGEVILGPIGEDGILGHSSNTFNNNSGGSISILGATNDGLGGSHVFNNNAGATLCIENVGGDHVDAVVNFTNNGTYNTSGCTPPTIPTMGEWALIIFGLIVLSIGVVYVMRWNLVSRKQFA